MRRLVRSVLMLITLLVASRSGALVISTSADPADGWRAIAPVGDQAGLPISSVGLAWEAAHVGWNNSLTFDGSDAAGWHPPVPRDLTRYGQTSTNNIWSDDPQGSGDTPSYFRLIFTLDDDPLTAQLGGISDYSNVVDDDAQIYLNGTLVWDDRDGVSTFIPLIDVTPYLHAGRNLLAVKAHDSFGVDEHFSLVLEVDAVPEPTASLLLPAAAAALAASRSARPRRH